MTLQVKITYPSTPLPGIVKLRKWGDKQLYRLDGMSTAGLGYGSFEEIPMASRLADNPERIEFGAITHFQRFARNAAGVIPELEYLKSIQPDDFKDWGFTLKQKMNWLIGDDIPPRANIYWTEGAPYEELDCTAIVFGTLGFGGQLLHVETDASGQKKIYKLWGKYRGEGIYKWIDFYKIIAFRKTDMGRPVSELLTEGKIQIATCANRSEATGEEDVYTEHLKGYVYTPIWSPYDWHTNTGNELFMAREFCEV